MNMAVNAAGQCDNSFQTFGQQLGITDETKKLLGHVITAGLVLWAAVMTEAQESLTQRIIWRFLLLCAVLRSMPYMIVSLLGLWVSGYGAEARRERSKSSTQPPPKLAHWLLCFFLSEEQRTNILGDAEEYFSRWVKRFGVKEARSRYYRDVRSTVWHRIIVFIRRWFS
jgi:hypothetical protein